MKLGLLHFLVLFLSFSCVKKEEPPRVQFIELGNPMSVISGAKLTKSFSNIEEFKSLFDGFELTSVYSYIQRRVPNEGDENIYAKELLSPSGTNAQVKNKFIATIEGDTLKWSRETPGQGIGEFVFEVQEDKSLKVTHLIAGKNEKPIEVLHQSIKEDNSAFSILIHGTSAINGEYVASYFYTKNESQKKDYTNKDYLYLAGNNHKIRWKDAKNLNLYLCGSEIIEYQYRILEGVSRWNLASEGNYKINLETLEEDYPPFSDLNTQCVYMINDYKTKGDEVSNPAVDLVFYNKSNNSIVDSDIFFFKKELEKKFSDFDSEEFYYNMNYVATHELGHFLGLDHQFDEEIESIMSYKHFTLADYDIEAINELYKEEKSDQ